MSQKWFNNIDLQQNELQNGVIQNLPSDPSSGKSGQIYYNTTDKGYRYHNGTTWVSITADAIKSIIAGNGLASSGTDTVTISLGTPSSSGSGSNTYGSNGTTANSHTHQISLPDATESTKGVIELATDAEATAGTDATRAINAKQLAAAKQSAIDAAKVTIQTSNGITGGSTSPGNSFTLSGVDASTTAKGVVQLATQDEVNTGTNTTKVVTPATLKKGKASGVASLDSDGKIIASQLPDYLLGQVMYGGNVVTDDSSTVGSYVSASLKEKLGITENSIQLSEEATGGSATGTYGYEQLEGVYFICQSSMSFGGIDFEVGDWLISTGESWQKIDNTDAVKSVNGKTGVVNITRVDEAGTADKVANSFELLGNDAKGNVVEKKYDGSARSGILFPENLFAISSDNVTGGVSVALKATGVVTGTYNSVTVDGFGRVTAGSNVSYSQKTVTTITGDGTTTDFTVTNTFGADVIVQVYLTGSTRGRRTGSELVFVDTYVEDGTTHLIHIVFATAPTTSQTFKVVVIG